MESKKKILIIEDDESSRESLDLLFKEKGFDTVSTGDGSKGLELMKTINPDLIITDNRLPNINGIELACINESFNKKIPIILMSGFDDVLEFIDNLNVIAFIKKPIDVKLLLFYVNQALKS